MVSQKCYALQDVIDIDYQKEGLFLADSYKKPQKEQSAWHDIPELGVEKLGENCGPECEHDPIISLLEISHLTVAYGRNLILRDVNLNLPAGQLTGLIGPNGAGKSTLLKSILGMVAFSGEVKVGGSQVNRNRPALAYVPQKEEVRWDFPVSVADVVMMGRYRRIGWLRRPGKADHEAVEDALEKVRMADFKKRQISQLSGGQQQRVFVARALAQEGSVILLDEPLTGIDSTSQEVILNLLLDLRRRDKLILMATHDLHAAAELCDATALINRKLIAYGPSKEVFKPELLASTFGGKVITLAGAGSATTIILD
ncbi:MAG TPA: metal ABC transporter ATP-binding protein [Chloroflexia bacterium]|nr:metal ABC transporter ATP-binding protein [Chloroflexia bacterium]